MDDDFFPLLPTSDSTLPEESSENATLLLSPFGNKDKVFNPGILILGGTQIFNDESKDKDLKVNTSSEAFLILEEHNFLSNSSDQELLFHLELSVTETLLSFSSENEQSPMKIFSFFYFCPKDKEIRGESSYRLAQKQALLGRQPVIAYDREDHRACFQSSNHSVSDHLHVYIYGIFQS
ncbi:hypothetical protein Tco_0897967 [Tanacetum coccineum]